MKRILIAFALVAISTVSFSGLGAAQGETGPNAGVQLPSIPEPVAVTLDAGTTAFLILDLLDVNCQTRPTCVAELPAVASLLQRARAANVPVVYSGFTPSSNVLPEVSPRADEPLIAANADKFLNPDFDRALKDRGAQTLVMVGTAANGAVLYTSFGANARGYTVVVAEDGISANNDFQVFLARYQLLNQPGFANPSNMPLQPNAVTLSRTDLIEFR